MNYVRVRFSNSEKFLKAILIDSYESLTEYQAYYQKVVDEAVSVTNTEVAIYGVMKISHLTHPIMEINKLITSGNSMFHLKGCIGSPTKDIKMLGKIKIKNMTATLNAGDRMLVNESGGYCSLGDGTIVEENLLGWHPKVEDFTNIVEGSRVINLENDFELEDVAAATMEKVWGFYSTITNLKLFTSAQLRSESRQFMFIPPSTMLIRHTVISMLSPPLVSLFIYNRRLVTTTQTWRKSTNMQPGATSKPIYKMTQSTKEILALDIPDGIDVLMLVKINDGHISWKVGTLRHADGYCVIGGHWWPWDSGSVLAWQHLPEIPTKYNGRQ
jgi:hypothetical protein